MDFTSRYWCDPEVRALLKLWCSPGTQKLLQNSARNKEVYTNISQQLRTMGFNRDWSQCRVKIKNLKYEYRAAKEGTFRGGPSHLARCMRFFNEMDNVLGRTWLQPSSTAASSANMSLASATSDDQYAKLSSYGSMSVLQAALTRDSSDQGASANVQLPIVKIEVPDSPPPDMKILETQGDSDGCEDTDHNGATFLRNSDLGPSAKFILTTSNDPSSPSPDTNVDCHDANQQHLPPPFLDILMEPSAPSFTGLQDSQIPLSETRRDDNTDAESLVSPTDHSSASLPTSQKRNRSTQDHRARRRRQGTKNTSLSKTLEKITGLFLRHERLSEEKYYRWEAQQRQMERLHELRMVSTVIKGLRGILQPATPAAATVENPETGSSSQP